MKDLLEMRQDVPPPSAQSAYDQALTRVKEGRSESGFKPVAFARPGDYIAVLDLDETLLHQWYSSGAQGNFDLKVSVRDNNGRTLQSPDTVKFTPATEKFILDLKKDPHNRGVVIFTAKQDQAAHDLIERWRFTDGTPARQHFSGIFTRNHLVVGTKILTPSKDLRIFDAELKHVVMVDDNPARIPQLQLLRAQPKFDADTYLKSTLEGNIEIARHYETVLENASREIRESAASAMLLNIPFSQAFLPYSYSGSRIYQSLRQTLKQIPGSEDRALEITRKNPALQEAAFFPATQN
jgi:hypothetical protein